MSDEHRTPEPELIERVVRELRRPVALGEGMEEKVMSAIEAERARRPWPAAGWRVAALAASLFLAAGVTLGVGRRERRPQAIASAQAARPVRFQLEAPASSHVAVVGDFNDWDPRASPMARVAGQSTWSVRLALPPGRYRYTFLVDGTRWVPDPSEPPALGDDFDTPTSVITVAGGAL